MRVKAGKDWQYTECRLGSSYASSSDSRLYFGLGNATQVTAVEVLWPSGQKDSYHNLDADRFYNVREGQGYVIDKRVPARPGR